MPRTHFRDSEIGEGTHNECFESLYDRGLPIPKGEWTEMLISLFLNYREKQEPAPLDLLAYMENAGIIVDEFERFVDARLALASAWNSRHIVIN